MNHFLTHSLPSTGEVNLYRQFRIHYLFISWSPKQQLQLQRVESGDATSRAQALGRRTTAYTIGATVGPALGGRFADRGDLYFSAKLAVIGSVLSVVLSLLFLPDVAASITEKKKNKKVIEKRFSSFLDSLRDSLAIGLRSSVWPLLAVKLIGGVVASMFSTVLPLVLTQQLQFEASQLGFGMSASMFSVAVFCGCLDGTVGQLD